MRLHSLLDMGEIRRDLGLFDKAEQAMLQALQLSQETHADEHGGDILKQPGLLYFKQLRLQDAAYHQTQAIEYSRKRHVGNECRSCEFELKKDLALTLTEQMWKVNSDEIYFQALELNAKVYGESSLDVDNILQARARHMISQRRFKGG